MRKKRNNLRAPHSRNTWRERLTRISITNIFLAFCRNTVEFFCSEMIWQIL